jgi:hypothetical protein
MNNNENSNDFIKSLLENFLITAGAVLGFLGNMENIDLILGIVLKITSILSFFFFLLINRSKIIDEFKKFKNK